QVWRTRCIDRPSAGIGPPLVVPNEQRRCTPPSGRALAIPSRKVADIKSGWPRSDLETDFIPELAAGFTQNTQFTRENKPEQPAQDLKATIMRPFAERQCLRIS